MFTTVQFFFHRQKDEFDLSKIPDIISVFNNYWLTGCTK